MNEKNVFLDNSLNRCVEDDHCTLKKINLKKNNRGTVSRGSCSGKFMCLFTQEAYFTYVTHLGRMTHDS